MNELSERSKKLATDLGRAGMRLNTIAEFAAVDKLIEQALLAERRLAKLEDAEIVEGFGKKSPAESSWTYLTKDIAQALRAAAGKEVGTK